MLVGVCGPQHAGKTTVSHTLVKEYGFYYIDGMVTFQSLYERASIEARKVEAGCGLYPVQFSGDSLETQDKWAPPAAALSQCWRSNVNVVIDGVTPQHPALPDLLKRPYFLLLYVESPALIRFHRASERTAETCFQSLHSFLEIDDRSMFDDSFYMDLRGPDEYTPNKDRSRTVNGGCGSTCRRGETLVTLRRLARVHVANSSNSLETLRDGLRALRLTDAERLRPCWDTYFMSLAKLASERTNCMKRRVGCVIARDRRVIATGYNGTPSGVTNCWSGGCARCNGAQCISSQGGIGLDLCLCLHAEENAIIEAGRERCQNATLYCNLFPCVLCAKKIVQAGIRQVVYDKGYSTDEASSKLLEAGNVTVVRFRRDHKYEVLHPSLD